MVGVTVDIGVNGPTRVSGEWSGSAWVDCTTQPTPSPVTIAYRATYDHVDSIMVLVDLDTRQVISIRPRSMTEATVDGEREFLGEHRGFEDCRVE